MTLDEIEQLVKMAKQYGLQRLAMPSGLSFEFRSVLDTPIPPAALTALAKSAEQRAKLDPRFTASG